MNGKGGKYRPYNQKNWDKGFAGIDFGADDEKTVTMTFCPADFDNDVVEEIAKVIQEAIEQRDIDFGYDKVVEQRVKCK